MHRDNFFSLTFTLNVLQSYCMAFPAWHCLLTDLTSGVFVLNAWHLQFIKSSWNLESYSEPGRFCAWIKLLNEDLWLLWCDVMRFAIWHRMSRRNLLLLFQDRRNDSSKTLVPVCQTTWHHIPEDHNIDTQYHGKLMSDMSSLFSAILFQITITNDLWWTYLHCVRMMEV